MAQYATDFGFNNKRALYIAQNLAHANLCNAMTILRGGIEVVNS
jgi:hypothetical protein